MRAIEVTYNQQEDTYHPHIHCIFAVKAQYFTKGYIKKSEWQYIWGECCKTEYEPIVHVQPIKIAHQRQLPRLLNIRSKLMI